MQEEVPHVRRLRLCILAPEEAEASYKQAIALESDYAEAHNNLGTTLQELGRLDEALASYKQAIALKPDYAEAHMMLTSMKIFDSQDEQYLKMYEAMSEYCKKKNYGDPFSYGRGKEIFIYS